GEAEQVREREAGGVPGGGGEQIRATPLDTDVAHVLRVRFDDACFDQDLRCLGVETAREVLDLVEHLGEVFGDDGVRALVDGRLAAILREHGLDLLQYVFGLCVVDRDQAHERR